MVCMSSCISLCSVVLAVGRSTEVGKKSTAGCQARSNEMLGPSGFAFTVLKSQSGAATAVAAGVKEGGLCDRNLLGFCAPSSTLQLRTEPRALGKLSATELNPQPHMLAFSRKPHTPVNPTH